MEKYQVEFGECHCGCREKTEIAPANNKRTGAIKGQPNRYIHGHHPRKSPVRYIVADQGYETPCWVWQGAVISKNNPRNGGYGNMYVSPGKTRLAHVVYYEAAKGPVPKGLELHHLCHEHSGCKEVGMCMHRRCINPDHLTPVSRRENILRGNSPEATRAYYAKITHCPHGHEYTTENTWIHGGGRACKKCSKLRNKGRLMAARLHPETLAGLVEGIARPKQ